MPGKRDNPLWETAVIVLSFLFLWAWILSSRAAHAQQMSLSVWWTVAQVVVALALVIVFVRRFRRAKEALSKEAPQNRNRRRDLP